jgi:uncharacterized membrane protein
LAGGEQAGPGHEPVLTWSCIWAGAFGSEEAAIRSLSALLGALAIPFAVLLGTRLFGRAGGLIAGLPLGLNPFHGDPLLAT